MATFTLRRFTNPATLKAIRKDNLLALLGRYDSYFASRGVSLVPAAATVLRVAEPRAAYGGVVHTEPSEDLDYEDRKSVV